MKTSPECSPRALMEYYQQGGNIMQRLMEVSGEKKNKVSAIRMAYELQSGSYVNLLNDEVLREKLEKYTSEMAFFLNELGSVNSMLEAGIGEATSFAHILDELNLIPAWYGGLDVSWSRIHVAQELCRRWGHADARLFVADLMNIPIETNGVELVYTAHAIEPNSGKERIILSELARISSKWIVLFEPSYELGSEETRSRIEKHGYCKGLIDIAEELGLEVKKHQLLENPMNPQNQTAVIVLAVDADEKTERVDPVFTCPVTEGVLEEHEDCYYSRENLSVFPKVGSIPCLLSEYSIPAALFDTSEDHGIHWPEKR